MNLLEEKLGGLLVSRLEDFSCSTQLSMKFKVLINTEIAQIY